MKVNGYQIKPGADLRNADLRYIDLEDANLQDAILIGADLYRANLSGAKLKGADLSDANLRNASLEVAILCDSNLKYADLTGANIRRCKGNGKEIKTIYTNIYRIVYTKDQMAISCKQHSIKEWFRFTDEEIDDMHIVALEFWKEWKPRLKQIFDAEGVEYKNS